MSPKTYQAFTLALALALGRAAIAQPGLIAELAAGPLLGIEHPLKGCSGGLLLGAAYGPFEAGLRASAAYDAGFDAALIFLDLELGLGSGLRAIVGGLLPLGELALADPSGGGTSVPVEEGPWPNRFGLASTLLDLPWRALGSRASLDASLVYTDYRAPRAASLAGAAAFAACVEGGIRLRLRWDGGLPR